jgi:stalled ribosome rescue protein Dom34
MDNNNMQTITIANGIKELDKFLARLNKKNGLVCMHGGDCKTNKSMNYEGKQ